ncbi:hypothetical protein ABW19_dt0206525 [Dactylella cylindrospora]|nr:hypothetical protein ABW19_dt0206525 [Dactylella cylindrospora]
MRCNVKSSSLLAFLLGTSLVAGLLPVVGFGPKDQDPFQSPELDMGNSKSSKSEPPTAQSGGPPIVSDALSVQRDVSIFAEFVRGSAPILKRLEDAGLNTTVLAPLNSAVKALPRKPWEDPDADGNAVHGAFAGLDGEKRAAENLERFVKAHMIPISPFSENEKIETLGGREIWWSTENGVTKIYPDGIVVKEVKNSVPNGQIWTLEGVINYSTN